MIFKNPWFSKIRDFQKLMVIIDDSSKIHGFQRPWVSKIHDFQKTGFQKTWFSKSQFLGQNFRGWDYSIFSLHGSGVFEDTDPEKIKSKHVLHAPDTGNHQNSSNFQKFQIRLNKMVQNSVEFSKKTNEILLKITILIENDQCWSKLITIIILIIPETSQMGGVTVFDHESVHQSAVKNPNYNPEMRFWMFLILFQWFARLRKFKFRAHFSEYNENDYRAN